MGIRTPGSWQGDLSEKSPKSHLRIMVGVNEQNLIKNIGGDLSLRKAPSEVERAWFYDFNKIVKSETESANGNFLAGEIDHGFI